MFTVEPVRGVADARFVSAENLFEIKTNGPGIVRVRLTAAVPNKTHDIEHQSKNIRLILNPWNEKCEGVRFVAPGASGDSELTVATQTYTAETKELAITLTPEASNTVMGGGELMLIDFYR